MLEKSYKRDFHLDCFLLDHQGKASLVTYFNLMQEIALKHANMLGFGFNDMVKNNMIWVLTRMGLEIYKTLKWDETITIKTWSRGIDGAYSFREFEFYDQQNNKIGIASSSWVPIDIQTRKPTKVFDVETVEKIAIKDSVEIELKKVFLPKEMEVGFHHKVRLTDLDINNHANNARYVEWIYNSLPKDFFQNQNGFKFHINYLGEAKLHDQVEIKRSPLDGIKKDFYFEGRNQTTDRPFFTAILLAD
jgi:acyl-ACP thioesterase